MIPTRVVLTIWAGLLALLFPPNGLAFQTIDAGEATAVQVTVYTENVALVQESRKVSLPEGEVKLQVTGLPAQIIPESVTVESLNQPDGLVVLEQQYDHDLPTQDALLKEFVGRKIKIVDWNKSLDRKEEVEALLLGASDGGVYQIDGQIFLGHPGYKVLPELPGRFTLRPTLTWLFQNRSQTVHDLRIGYLTRELSWRADYVLLMKKAESLADLEGWVTVSNQCGADFKMARLRLVAGGIHRVESPPQDRPYARVAMKEAAAPQLEERSFFEYHLYDLKRPTDIVDKQTKQVRLLEAREFKITEALVTEGSNAYLIRPFGGHDKSQPVKVVISFKNNKENGLGIPLPGGIARLYKEDDDGSPRFVGEDRIAPSPPNETIRVTTGQAFDVISERVQTDFKQISTRLYESQWEITLRNQKEKAVRVSVEEPMTGNWSVVNSSQPYEKTDAFTIRFDVQVPAGGEASVTYRVKVGL
jgi:hypothetical protein